MRREVSDSERVDFQLTQGGFYQLEFLDPDVGRVLDGWYILGRYKSKFQHSASRRFYKVNGMKSGTIINPSVVIHKKTYSILPDCVAIVTKYIPAEEMCDYIEVNEDKIIAKENSKVKERIEELTTKLLSLESDLAAMSEEKSKLLDKIDSTTSKVKFCRRELASIKEEPVVIDNVAQTATLEKECKFFYVEAVFLDNPKKYTWEISKSDINKISTISTRGVIVDTAYGPEVVTPVRFFGSPTNLNHKKVVGVVYK